MKINALKDLVESKGFNLSDQSTFKGEAFLVSSVPKKSRGSIAFEILCNVHSVDSSSLFFSEEIRSYGIKYREHKPFFEAMEYDSALDRLNFKNKEYVFYLENIRIT